MKVRLRAGVKMRHDSFGGICYVPHRDDFFAANEGVFGIIKQLKPDWSPVDAELDSSYSALARLGICETEDPATSEEAYSGPSFLGDFLEIPTVEEPLVLNCFCTAHCPLKCIYCHADDLMQGFRGTETDDQLDNVISTARMINSIVVVVTGGDPLTKPERAIRIIDSLADRKALVLDTSGVGDLDALLPTLKRHSVHVRVSLDAAGPTNQKVRPINTGYLPVGTVSGDCAKATILACLSEGLGVTVQTVVSARNDTRAELSDLRDWMVSKGVRHWVLHLTVKGGSARRMQSEAMKKARPRGILPGPEVYGSLQKVIRETKELGGCAT